MAWTQERIDALKDAIASGVLSISYGGPPARQETFQSIDDMLKALALMERAVNGGTPYRVVSTSKGFGK